MPHSPATASGDEPRAAAGLTTQDLAALQAAGGGRAARELAALLQADGDLTAEDVAALAQLDDVPDTRGHDRQAGTAPGADWLALPDEDLIALLDGEPAPTAVPEALEAGFTHHIPTPGATGFAAGGPLDAMLPGSDLAWHAAQARRRGLGELSDDEVCGLMGAARRLESWAAGLKLATVNELDARRAGADSRPGEHVADEVAAVLTLTPRAASDLIGLVRNLGRVPQTRALLAAGIIDQDRAAVIADALAVLDVTGAALVENQVTPRAEEKTTRQLRAACDSAIKAYDPQAAKRRRERAEKEARVECWAESAGTSAIAGRDLAPAGVIAADRTLDADARWLRAHGMPGSHDERRAAAFLARLTNRPLDSLLPQAAPADAAPSPAPGSPGAATATGTAAPGARGATTAAGPGTPNATGTADPGTPNATGTASPGTPSAASAPGWPGGLSGSVNLTMPASAWLGLSDAPGEAGGPGALDADTCRDLASALAANPATRWCVTLVDSRGRATAHGCARAGPGPPGPTSPTTPAAWLATVKITPIETGTCSHRRESAGYQPSNLLRHIIKIRSPRCGFPGCRRPAVRCDDDHTVPYDQGGRTCECNLYPLCRRHHQAKQAPGWRLDQPEPGVLIWTLPSGRQYTTTAEPYPV
jgi:hypothetical protein